MEPAEETGLGELADAPLLNGADYEDDDSSECDKDDGGSEYDEDDDEEDAEEQVALEMTEEMEAKPDGKGSRGPTQKEPEWEEVRVSATSAGTDTEVHVNNCCNRTSRNS